MESTNAAKELIKQKDAIEAEIKALHDVLDSQASVGMKESLVDEENFPRADIDIYSVRHARHKIIRLQNDHKALMKQIEESLHRIHSQSRDVQMDVDNESVSGNSHAHTPLLNSFVRVDRVDPGSPAADAGLKVGDEICRFGSIRSENFQNLQTIGTAVQHSKDVSLPVTVIRDGKELRLSLTPKTWSGRGLLGCNILPISR